MRFVSSPEKRKEEEGAHNNNSHTENGNDAIVGFEKEEPGVCHRGDRDRCVYAATHHQFNTNND